MPGARGDIAMTTCDNCGFSSENWRMFMRPLDGRQGWTDKRICKCGWKCYRRQKERAGFGGSASGHWVISGERDRTHDSFRYGGGNV